MKVGRVTLIGAGPGDPALMTLKGMQYLKQADVILYDQLVHPTLLTHCKPEAQCISVGKSKGNHSQTQAEINQKMLSYAKAGFWVVRLKGGDPMIFGRAGEEMALLKKEGIPYEIIPGITSAIAAPTYAGIPLTHRDYSQSVAFVTGTNKEGAHATRNRMPQADTLVFLMAVTHLQEIIQQLKEEGGKSKETPAALIYKGTLADQKVVVGTLETLYDLHEKEGVTHPSILVVGEVAALATTLQWREALSLMGKRTILLRQSSQAEELAQALMAQGAEVVYAPMIQTQRKASAEPLIDQALKTATVLILTSPNGVRHLKETLTALRQDSRALSKLKIASIGPKTSEALAEMGIRADIEAKEAIAEGILEVLPEDISSEVVLLPQSNKARKDLSEALKLRGAQVIDVALYATEIPEAAQVDVKAGDIVIFTSSSTVDHFFQVAKGDIEKICPVVIGPITQKTLAVYTKKPPLIAEESSINGLVSCILRSYENNAIPRRI